MTTIGCDQGKMRELVTGMPDVLIFRVEATSAVFRIEFKPGDDELGG